MAGACRASLQVGGSYIQSGETIWPMSAAQLVLMSNSNPCVFQPLPWFSVQGLQNFANVTTVAGFFKPCS